MEVIALLGLAVLLMGGSSSSRPSTTPAPQPTPQPKQPDAGAVITDLVAIGVDLYRRYLSGGTSSNATKEH